MRFRNGLPRQCVPQGHLLRGAHWLAMTGFFDSLTPACVSMRVFLQPFSAQICFGKTASRLLRRMFSYARRPNGRSFLCAGRRGDVASPPTGDLPHPSVGRGPRAPPGSMHIARRDTWVPPYESYCAPFRCRASPTGGRRGGRPCPPEQRVSAVIPSQ